MELHDERKLLIALKDSLSNDSRNKDCYIQAVKFFHEVGFRPDGTRYFEQKTNKFISRSGFTKSTEEIASMNIPEYSYVDFLKLIGDFAIVDSSYPTDALPQNKRIRIYMSLKINGEVVGKSIPYRVEGNAGSIESSYFYSLYRCYESLNISQKIKVLNEIRSDAYNKLHIPK